MDGWALAQPLFVALDFAQIPVEAARSWMPGLRRSRGHESGRTSPPVVDLIGSTMRAIVPAIPEVATRTQRPVIVVGGLAVICRLGSPYRVTTDFDMAHPPEDPRPAVRVVACVGGEHCNQGDHSRRRGDPGYGRCG